ncbi:MAG: Na+/H+ antiporter NhaA [Solirubrobacteraceae bacterium]
MSAADVPIGSGSLGSEQATAGPAPSRSAWARSLEEPLREFLRTQSGSAAILLGATVAALVWANADRASYDSVWSTTLAVSVGNARIALGLRGWVNSGLMSLFFLVVGLEARREFDLGELRDRRRLALPFVAGVGGMLVPIAIFVAINRGGAARGGWGAAMSTDTAFALGLVAIVGRGFPNSLRAFLLTVAVVDDLVALGVIAVAFTSSVDAVALAVAVGAFVVLGAAVLRGVQNGAPYALLGLVAWVALERSGIDPVVVGLAIGLMTIAYPAAREDLAHATDLFRVFREQPSSQQQQSVSAGLRSAISPNERWQHLFHPFTSYLVVPLFALANAGFQISGSFLAHAYGAPVTLGILLAYVIGKPLGIAGGTALVNRASRGRIVPPVGWASVLGGGAIAGIGFTVSLLIATLAFRGPALAEAKLGILTTLIVAPALTWGVVQLTARLPRRARVRALVGSADAIVDLAVAVDPERDHIRGPAGATVTLLEYGDLECPYCGQAEAVIRELLADFGELRYVWRHLPLSDVHRHAQLAAEASEAASAQGRFWEMHDTMLSHQGELTLRAIIGYARDLELDLERFKEHLRRRKGASRIAEDIESADRSGVSGTPTFFINGHRHQAAYDLQTLSGAVRLARARAVL